MPNGEIEGLRCDTRIALSYFGVGGGIFLLWVSAWIYLKHSCLQVNKVAVGTVHVAFVVVYAQWLDGNVVSWLWPASGCHRGGRVSDDVCKVLQPRG